MATRSKRVDAGFRRELEIPDIGPEPHPQSSADGSEDDAAFLQERYANAADQIGGAFDTAKARVDLLGSTQIVHEYHHARTREAEVVTDGWPLPKDLLLPVSLRHELTLTVAQAC